MNEILIRIPSPEHGLEDVVIAMVGSSMFIEVSYHRDRETLFGRFEFTFVLGSNVESELVSAPPAGTYDNLIEAEQNEWSRSLANKVHKAFYPATPKLYQVYLTNFGLVSIVAADVQAELDLRSPTLSAIRRLV